MTTFRLAALDMAGTTIDEEGLVYEILGLTAADAVGEPLPHHVLEAWKGTSKWEALRGVFAAVGADDRAEVVDRYFAQFSERLADAYRTSPPVPFPGVVDAIAELRAHGVKVALQTGYSGRIAEAILDGIGWTIGSDRHDGVDALVTSDDVVESRPAPYLIFRCMELTGVHDVRSVVSAGDTPNDVRAGRNAGCGLVVGVLTGSFDRGALGSDPHTCVLSSVAELPALVLGSSNVTLTGTG